MDTDISRQLPDESVLSYYKRVRLVLEDRINSAHVIVEEMDTAGFFTTNGEFGLEKRDRLYAALKGYPIRKWNPPETIVLFPEFISDAMTNKRLLVCVPQRDDPVIGYYLGGLLQEWRIEGSNNEQKVTCWMPLPNKP